MPRPPNPRTPFRDRSSGLLQWPLRWRRQPDDESSPPVPDWRPPGTEPSLFALRGGSILPGVRVPLRPFVPRRLRRPARRLVESPASASRLLPIPFATDSRSIYWNQARTSGPSNYCLAIAVWRLPLATCASPPARCAPPLVRSTCSRIPFPLSRRPLRLSTSE